MLQSTRRVILMLPEVCPYKEIFRLAAAPTPDGFAGRSHNYRSGSGEFLRLYPKICKGGIFLIALLAAVGGDGYLP
jgi:hypothetical protein